MERKREVVTQRHRIIDRALSLVLVFAMILSLLQTVPGPLLTVWADEPGGTEQVQPGDTAKSQVSIKVHFDNLKSRWGSVCAYAGNIGWSAIEGYEALMSWPGNKMVQDTEHPGYYTLEVTKEALSGLVFIFNNGSGGTKGTDQTYDLTIDAEMLKGVDTYECWVDVSSSAVSTTEPDDWASPVISPQVDGRSVTFRYKDAAASQVSVAGTMFPLNESGGWTAQTMSKESGENIFSYTGTFAPGSYEYKFVLGDDWIADPNNDKVTGKDFNSVLIVPGIKDGSMEVARGSSAILPNALDMVLPDGTEEAREVAYTIKTENATGVTFNAESNKITIGSNYTEDTLELTAEVDGYTGTYTIQISDDPNFFVSPEIDGNTVTFRYKDDTAESVDVAGNMFPLDEDGNWFVETMAKQTDSNIFAYTGTFAPGSYEYKFIVDGEWIADPKNTMTVNGNSVFYVAGLVSSELTAARGKTTTLPAQLTRISESGRETPVDVSYTLKTSDPSVTFDEASRRLTIGSEFTGKTVEMTAEAQDETVDVLVTVVDDTNEVTIKIHYTRPDGDYAGWNVWAWAEGRSGAAYDFVEKNGEGVAEITLEGRSNKKLGYIIRKGEWEAQEPGGDRWIDFANVVSGTVHFYIASGAKDGRVELGEDAVVGVKILSAEYQRESNQIVVTTGIPIPVDADSAFTLKRSDGTEITITNVTAKENQYTLDISEDLSSLQAMVKSYSIIYNNEEDFAYTVTMPNLYSSDEFEDQYTYSGDDLGATWTESKTTFKVWAPTAETVKVNLYESGTEGTEDLIEALEMEMDAQGVWSAEKAGDISGAYYTYEVTVDGKTTEACDPYARTTGVNGKRAMVIDLTSTDPEGWENDRSPNQGMSYTDSIIYELHVRDFSINENSGIENKGKFLGLTEKGTTSTSGQTTGLDYLTDLGVTHIHLLPSYDYGSVDETKLDEPQYNWGYDPVNYNVPEGSYSTDPYNGEVRVKEMKKMVQALHNSNINVIMDVVYNHVYDAESFCFNQLVPKYFSRTNADGSYSNGSGCGNDTASEREMVKKYIVDSVNYWADEYHIDGFRFDLVGLLDTKTINEVVETVHEKHPDVVFYGEGWTMNTALSKEGYTMATQANSAETPQFAYFSDTIRDLLKGGNDETSLGFVSGLMGKEENIAQCFTATTSWCHSPTQTVNYASCHDNYTLKDKLNASKASASEEDRIRMNNLAAAIYLTAEGIPLIHAGEEILRTKVDENGNIIHNSYNSSDFVNSIKWADLDKEEYRDVRDYYKGLIEFRKNHAALRLTSAAEVAENVEYKWITNEVVMFVINGKESVETEVSDGIVVIFNATGSAQEIDLSAYGVAGGEWKVCINHEKAGIEPLAVVTDGEVTVEPISAMVLVKGETEDADSIYVQNRVTPVTKVTLDETTLALQVGVQEKLIATVKSDNGTDVTVTWSSSNPDVATVDEDGTVHAVSAGTAVITATANDGSGAHASCTVNVSDPDPDDVPVTSITFNKQTLSLRVGKSEILTTEIMPENATNKTVIWASDNRTVATVDTKGRVNAKSAGTAVITATAASGAKAKCTVTVIGPNTDPDPDPDDVLVTAITLSKQALSMEIGKTENLTAEVTPNNATDKTVTWTSDKPAIATVNANGTVTAVSAGTAVITAAANDGSGVKAECTVTVKAAQVITPPDKTEVKATSISLSAASLKLAKGKTKTLTATVLPANATDGTVTFISSKPSIVSVGQSSGVVTAKKTGTATITAKTAGGLTATCKVTVVIPSTKVLTLPNICIVKGKTKTLSASVIPANSTDTLTWSSSKKKTVSVNKKGKIKGLKTGTAKITVKTESGKKATCKVTVVSKAKKAASVKLNKKKLTLKVGKVSQLKATMTAKSTDTLKFSSSKKKVAKVDKNGVVTALKKGTATITVKTSGGKKATCKITVK